MSDLSDALFQAYADLPPLEPIKLTQEQLDKVKAVVKPAPPGMPPPLTAVPIHIVERVEDSTPYLQRLSALKRLAEEAMQVPFPTPAPPPRFTVLVAESHEQCVRWCWENHRSPHDRNVIRITDGFRDQYKLQGLTDFEVVVLDPCRGYDEVMAYVKLRQSAI